jgi:hypothetical protein
MFTALRAKSELTSTPCDVGVRAPILERTRESHHAMRSDMHKIIVERPRRSKGLKARALRFRNSLDGPSHLGMRVGYGYRELNENINGSKAGGIQCRSLTCLRK